MRTCCVCKAEKGDSEFYPKVKTGGAKKKYLSSYCKPCEIKRINEMKRRLRATLISYGGGACKKCGYNRCVEALEFHHRDQNAKEVDVRLLRSFNDTARQELDKCDLLCANCHAELHFPHMNQ